MSDAELTPNAHTAPALRIKDLSKQYPNGFQALKQVSLEVAPGDFFALLGPNGAGKSTLIGIVSSLLKKTLGQVAVFGHDLDKNVLAAKQLIGLVPQEFNFNQFERVIDVLITQAGFYGVPRKIALSRGEALLKSLGLWDKRDQVSRNLSGGMKRRLMIARALVHQPKLLILDEPTAGVDIELRRSMWEFLQTTNDAGTTIILTTHYLEEAELLCRNVAIIDRGEIIKNASVKDIVADLDQETFVLDLQTPIAQNPLPEAFHSVLLEQGQQLEITIARDQQLNDVFAVLNEKSINITSLKNKTNRLEELFVSLISQVKEGLS